jgi:hypothetical protein
MDPVDLDSEPSILYVFWPEDSLPLLEEVRCQLDGWAEQSGESEEHGTFWSNFFTVPEHPIPIHVWACPREQELLVYSFNDVRWGHPEERKLAERSQWMLGIATLLNPADPLLTYHLQLRFGMALCPTTPAIYDSCSHVLRSGSEIDRLTSTKVPPRTNELFSIHVVVDSEEEEQSCWLHSHGLNRARAPEIDLLDVPVNLRNAGSHLINGVAELLIGSELPEENEVFPIGHDLQIIWKHWQNVVKDGDDRLGGKGDREGLGNDHGGYRNVLLQVSDDQTKAGTPLTALKYLEEKSRVLFVSKRETERMARLARERWAIFGMLFARHKDEKDDPWRFLAKLGYEVDEEDSSEREHLWFEVHEIAPGRLKGKLLNEPVYVSRLKDGAEGWHELSRLTDWNILSAFGAFNPETADYLWDAARPEIEKESR